MKRFAGLLVLVLLTQAPATAQSTRRFTHPAVPSEAALNRLNLKVGWQTYVPTDGVRDGLRSVQVFGDVMVVQTYSGAVVALDVRDGTRLWRARFGTAYRPSQPVGYNDRSFFLIQGTDLFAIDRHTGQLQWEFDLPSAANAAPAADAGALYIPLGTGRLVAYELPARQGPVAAPAKKEEPAPSADKKPASAGDRYFPGYGVGGQASSPGGPLGSSYDVRQRAGTTQLRQIWTHVTEARLEGTPLLSPESVLIADTGGNVDVLSKENSAGRYSFPLDAPVSAPLAQHRDQAYIASQDYVLYALDVPDGRLLWRFAAGGPILTKPAVNNDSVYLGIRGVGLYRIERSSGRALWRNPQAERFLAANKKFVYALDSYGRLLLLDQARGRELATLDTRDLNAPIRNIWTDRLFLAGNDGLIVCLHDRDYRTPLVMNFVGKKAPVVKPQTSPLLKDEDKPKDGDKPEAKPEKKAEKPKAEDMPEKKDDKPPTPQAKPATPEKKSDKPKAEAEPQKKDDK